MSIKNSESCGMDQSGLWDTMAYHLEPRMHPESDIELYTTIWFSFDPSWNKKICNLFSLKIFRILERLGNLERVVYFIETLDYLGAEKETLEVFRRLNFYRLWDFQVICVLCHDTVINMRYCWWKRKERLWFSHLTVMNLCVKLTKDQLCWLHLCHLDISYSHLGRRNLNWENGVGSVEQWIAHWTSSMTERFKGCGFESRQSRRYFACERCLTLQSKQCSFVCFLLLASSLLNSPKRCHWVSENKNSKGLKCPLKAVKLILYYIVLYYILSFSLFPSPFVYNVCFLPAQIPERSLP